MKRYINKIVVLLSLLLMVTACMEETWVGNNNVKEGVPVTMCLSFSSPEMTLVQTKANTGTRLINDLYIFIFNKEGNFVSGENYKPEGTDDSSGLIKIETTSGTRHIYAIANTKSGMYPTINEQVSNIIANKSDETTFLNMVAKLAPDNNNVELNDGIMLMSGQWEGENGNKDCLIPANSEVTLDGTISIRRVAAKITFSIEDGKDSKGKFTPVEYMVKSIPNSANIFKEAPTPATPEYFDLQDFTPIRDGGTFTFYISENIQRATNCSTVDDRELSENGIFKKAPANSTYVIVKGTYSGKAGISDADATAPRVLYFIHLGKGAGTSKNTTYDANDFSTERNTDYTYNMTVNGVDNIVMEVLTNSPETDNHPREEGDIIFGGAENVFRCDAHFEQRLLTFTKNDKLKDFSFAVKTPYTTAVYDADTEVPTGDDVNWVKFYKTGSADRCVTYTDAYKDTDNFWDVKKLVSELKKWKGGTAHTDWADEIYFTCFVDEYYYRDKPNEWGKYVNTGEDRTMQILCSSNTQQDKWGNSSVTQNAQYVISQRPIQTIYNKDKNGQIIGWGIETINETGRLKLGDGIGNSEEHGLDNFKIKSGNWSTYVDFTKIPTLGDHKGYMNYALALASYACLQRNRDENGNNIIDEDEIKWYLPASKQMVSLWIGNEALSQEANIYGSKGGEGKVSADRHFFTSTNNNKSIYWAEEGYSLGNDNGYIIDDDNTRQYRCVRDLGRNGTNNAPTPIYDATTKNIYLSPLALRQAPVMAELRSHHEREEVNRAYKGGFIYSTKENDYIDVDSWRTLNSNANDYPTSSFCQKEYGTGWRLPNQRELGLLYIGGLEAGTFLCRTYYSGYPKDASATPGETHTFRINGGLLTLHPQTVGGSYRCVKDNY